MLRFTKWMYKRKNTRTDRAMADHDRAVNDIEGVVREVLSDARGDQSVDSLADSIMYHVFTRRCDLAMRAAYPHGCRVWYEFREDLFIEDCPWVARLGDEFGNNTVRVRIPGAGAIVAVTDLHRKKIVERTDAHL